MLPSPPAFMLPTAHLHHHHHHHFQGAQPSTDPQWQAHPHYHARSAGRKVDLGPADILPTGPVSSSGYDGGGAAGGAAATEESYPAGPYDMISPAGAPPTPLSAAMKSATAGEGRSSDRTDMDAPPTRGSQYTSSAARQWTSGSATPGSVGGVSGTGGGLYGRLGGGGGGAAGSYPVSHLGGASSAAAGPSGFAARRPPLHSLQWVWSAVVWFWSTAVWFVIMPWRVLVWSTPSFLRPAEQWVEGTVEEWTGPPTRLAADVMYGIISWFDGLFSSGRRSVQTTHSSNMHHFWVAYEAYLRLIQHKAHLIEQHGLDGLWMALNTKTV